ncbi:hypothetical protein D8W71_06855 [Rhodococcus sp. P1Y]|nr:hypothetical protein D8W71_06855 [Rhodococcus sp. P1Y]
MALIAFALAVGFYAFSPLFSVRALLPLLGMLTLFTISRPIYYFADGGASIHVGIAGSAARLTTAGAVIAGLAMWFFFNRSVGAVNGRLLVPVVVYLGVALLVVWDRTLLQYAGALALLTAVGAWYVGAKTAHQFASNLQMSRLIAWSVFLVVVAQSAISILQEMQIAIFVPTIVDDDTVTGRANGTFDHPASLGKMILLLCIVALPFTFSLDSKTRILSRASIVGSTVPLALSAGRANILAYVVLIALWLAISALRGRLRFKLTPSFFVLVPLLAFIAVIGYTRVSERNESDPFGGSRARFLDVALSQLDNIWLFGVGPNTYVAYFGQFDRLTGVGWPVHNAPLLLLTEIGAAGLILLAIPFAYGTVRAVQRFRGAGLGNDAAAVWVCSMIALYPVVTTGWGLVNEWTFPALMWTFGFLFQTMDEGLHTQFGTKDQPGRTRTGTRGSQSVN